VARALPVTTKLSQVGLGWAPGEVMTSTASPFEQALQPFARTGVGDTARITAAFVNPVRSDARLGHRFHVVGADLHLDRKAVGCQQGGVQGLVTIRLGDGNIVLELARHRLVQVMDGAEYPVTGVDLVHHNAESEHIHHIGKGQVLVGHLQVDTVEVFLPAADVTGQPLLAQPLLD